jgi:dTDP-4-dehydrorhamnose 3,5-epimerase
VRTEKTDRTVDLVLILQLVHDNRGLAYPHLRADIFDDYLGRLGISASYVDDSHSRSARGHPRLVPAVGGGEAKLVRCANGAVHDVLIDIRRDDPTLRQAADVSA